MQDQDAPPVEEGETDGGVVVVQEAELRVAVVVVRAAINSTPASTPLQWITAIARRWPAETMARACACVRDSAPTILRRSLSRCRVGKTRTPESSALWTTSFFKRRSRKPLAN